MSRTDHWRTVPSQGAHRPSATVHRSAVAVLIAVVAPMAWMARTGIGVPVALGLLGVVAVLVMRRVAVHRATLGVGVALAAGGAGVVLAGGPVGLWFLAGLLIGAWLCAPVDDPFLATAPPRGYLSAAVLSVITAALAISHRPAWAVALPAVAVCVIPLLEAASRGRVTKWVDAFAAGVSNVIIAVLFGLLSVPVVLVPYVYGRLAGIDPFDASGHWRRPPRRRSPAHGAWANDRPPRPQSPRRAFVATAIVLVLGMGWLHLASARTQPPPKQGLSITVDTPLVDADTRAADDPMRFPAPDGVTEVRVGNGEVPAAQADAPWWSDPAYSLAQGYLFWEQAGTRHDNPYQLLDLRSTYVNIVNGSRQSWSAPTCDCPRVTVWMYGGSTTYGMGQRDGHTIASELARVAFEHGLVVDVENRGMNGFSHAQEAERFAWDLTAGSRPDLALFYDGVNDMFSVGPGEPLVNASMEAIWDKSGRSAGEVPDGPEGSVLPPEADIPPEGDPEHDWVTGVSIVRRYDRIRQMSQLTAAAHNIPVRYVWQPTRYTRPFEPSEPHHDTEAENEVRRFEEQACANVARDVINACDALLGLDGPIFTDDAHHNERGARAIAEFLFAELESDLRTLAAAE